MSGIILVLSNSRDSTSDYLCARLRSANVRHIRLDTDRVLETASTRIISGEAILCWDAHIVHQPDVSAVVLRRPRQLTPCVLGDAHQRNHAADEWAEVIEGFLSGISTDRWINYGSRNADASNKLDQLSRAPDFGLATPPWIVTSMPDSAHAFFGTHGPELIAKPLAGGHIERDRPEDDTIIYTSLIDRTRTKLFDRLRGCPVLLQKKVDKTIDVRLIAIDDQVMAVGLEAHDLDGSQRLDIRRNDMRDVVYSSINVPSQVSAAVTEMMVHYGLRFAALDFVIDTKENWVFLELNPNGQWAWLDLQGRADVGQMFVDALARASRS